MWGQGFSGGSARKKTSPHTPASPESLRLGQSAERREETLESGQVGGYDWSFSWKAPHFSQTFIIRGRVMIT